MIVTPILIFFLIVVFVLLWLFIKTIDKRKWLTLLITVVLTPIVYFYAFYPFINIFSSHHHLKYFNAEAWTEKPALRFEMTDHLQDDKILIGKTKVETINLLGKNEWLSWNDSLKTHDENRWNYGLGLEPGAFNIMKECIEVVFKNDKVTAVKQFQMEIKFDE